LGRRRRLRTILPLAALLAALGACTRDPAGAEGSRRPSFVVVVADTLRADRLTLHGNPRPTSRNIEVFASRGVVFDRAFAQAPWTAASMASLFTGTYQSVHQVRRAAQKHGELGVLDERFVTLAELFRDGGYRTAAFSAQAWVVPEIGFGQGFEEFQLVSGIGDVYETDRVVRSGMAWLREHGDEPFLLYLHILNPHSPYHPPVPFNSMYWRGGVPRTAAALQRKPVAEHWDALIGLGQPGGLPVTDDDVRFLLSMYDAEITYVDWWLGALGRELVDLGLAENTVVVITSDHGEAFREHGFFGHHKRVYNPELAVPLVISNPLLFPESRRVSEPVELVDVLPTLAALAGLEPPAQVQGENLLNGALDGVAYSEGVNLKEYKLQDARFSLIADAALARYRLFDLAADPGEQRDVYAEHPAVAERMTAELLRRRRASLEHPLRVERGSSAAVDPEVIERLRVMGYVE
jgi:arylsulfatase A-like enzyme